MAEIHMGIEMAAQKQYEQAVEKYGEDFADAVVEENYNFMQIALTVLMSIHSIQILKI